MSTLGTILKDNWEWRKQIAQLSVFELRKKVRGTAFGWAWLLVKPAVYLLVFWFVISIGLRGGRSISADCPFFLWLMTGMVPWFFMSDMLGTGTDVLHRYSYLVKKVAFPQSAISTMFALSSLIINMILMIALIGVYFAYGMPLDIYLIQFPFLILLMLIFWICGSVLISQISGVSKDIGELMKTLHQPFFWLSGILYDLSILDGTGFEWVSDMMLFNPVTFFVTAFRDALCYKTWIWEDPLFLGAFVFVFALTIILMCLAYRHFSEEVVDAL